MSRERRTIPVVRQSAASATDCPLAPPEHASVHARALHRACLILGGVQQLADHLKASVADVSRWLKGQDAMPEWAFLAAVEVILLNASGSGLAS
jgi:hypothetical protein